MEHHAHVVKGHNGKWYYSCPCGEFVTFPNWRLAYITAFYHVRNFRDQRRFLSKKCGQSIEYDWNFREVPPTVEQAFLS